MRKKPTSSPKTARHKSRQKWISTAIPRTLAREANQLIKSGIGGYHSLTNLVEDAVRRRLEQLRPKDEAQELVGAVTT